MKNKEDEMKNKTEKMRTRISFSDVLHVRKVLCEDVSSMVPRVSVPSQSPPICAPLCAGHTPTLVHIHTQNTLYGNSILYFQWQLI